ncbi:hypothetical protein N8D28_11005 [Enterococcus faecium]
MNEADILETTYEDSCIIERLTDIGEYKIFCVNEKIHTKKEVPSVE